MLHSYLSHWDEVVIVLYYRRYYDMYSSQYRHLHDTGKLSETIIQYFQKILQRKTPPGKNYIAKKLLRKFENVVIINYHDKRFRGSGESFYCHAMPNATHICDAIKSEETKRDNARSSRQIDFQDLIHYAMDFKESDRNTARKIAQKYLEETKNLTMRKTCLDEDAKEKLLNKTLEFKQNVYPGDNEDELKSQFEKDVLTKLCTVDMDETLKDKAWKSFFQSISKEYKGAK
ncbi:hypothetical protein CTEN210_08909 [Chaetoceros tenuissimus]|uniref:Uncharacterized protein n=1 Tax=Chaetoceros tenuissimus TaxID=426638 RepID=A0AAD3CUN0_9STRA|nr:hypothetical protein CTEN210_08909 [Chaetoceros tenuissimus]